VALPISLKFLGDDSKLSYSIKIDGSSWEFTVTTPAGERSFKFTLGAEFDTDTLDGRPIKVI